MIRSLKRKKQRQLLLLYMIVVGISLLAIISAAVGCAAVRRCKWFSEISSPQEATAFISLDRKEVLPRNSLKRM